MEYNNSTFLLLLSSNIYNGISNSTNMKINRAFIKWTNWVLAGILSMLGFIGCDKMNRTEEYGTPHADYTVKGTVVEKATGKPIAGIRVGYDSGFQATFLYGVPPTPFVPKSSVLTDAKGEFKLSDTFFPTNSQIPVYVEDIDGPENGLFQSDTLQISFSEADRTKKADYTVKGTVVDKATGKPITGIRVGYDSGFQAAYMYGVPPTPFVPKSSVLTDAKGEFKLSDTFFPTNNQIPVYIEDIDGPKNGLFQSDTLQISFSEADRTKKSKSWYSGEFTKELNVELTEIQPENP